MNLYPLRAELALMYALRESDRAAPGPVELRHIRSQWPRYALRGRDLPMAMDRLSAGGLIDIVRARNRMTIILTDAGRTWLRSKEALLAKMLLLPRYVRGQIGQLRRWRPTACANPLRRNTDRVAEQG